MIVEKPATKVAGFFMNDYFMG